MGIDVPGVHGLPLFVAAGVLLNITPGQDTIYIVGRSLAQGRQAGFISVGGIISGAAIHTLAAAFGLSAVFAASPAAFQTVKFAGAAYLVYVGLRLLGSASGVTLPTAGVLPESGWRIYRAGLWTNLLNPKVSLFFLAFLPQFVAADAAHPTLALLTLGAIFVCTGTLWCLVLVVAASAAGSGLRRHPAAVRIMNKGAGAVFVGLGVRLATTD